MLLFCGCVVDAARAAFGEGRGEWPTMTPKNRIHRVEQYLVGLRQKRYCTHASYNCILLFSCVCVSAVIVVIVVVDRCFSLISLGLDLLQRRNCAIADVGNLQSSC